MKGGLGQMLRQAQEKLEQAQEELASLEATGSAGGGVVTVTLNGRYQARAVSIDDAFVGGDREMLEDLVTAAVNEAPGSAQKMANDKMASPSTLGLVARMISSTGSVFTRFSSGAIRRSSGPTPFMGEIAP